MQADPRAAARRAEDGQTAGAVPVGKTLIIGGKISNSPAD
jgi:hypothetical protein